MAAVAVLAAGAAVTLRPSAVEAAGPQVTAVQTVPASFARNLRSRKGFTRTITTSFSVDGEKRFVVLHVPDGLLAPAPLLVALHGRAQGPDAIRTYSRLERLADRKGFIVAFPSGAAASWNAGGCCQPATGKGVDDVAWLDEVLRLVRARAPVDPNRISFTGGSNGAMMALDYACERPLVVSAVAVVAGPYVSSCRPTRPTAVLELHGANDHLVPLAGGVIPSLGVRFPPVSASFDPFRRAGGEVRVQIVPKAGHIWMTRDLQGVDASQAVWDWVRDHPLLQR